MTVEEIFAEALAHRDPRMRSQYIASACAGNSELMVRVQALLAAHDRANSFLEVPAAASAQTAYLSPLAAAAGQPDQTLRVPNDEAPGVVIGRYKLLQLIGEGGFGTVWMAEQREPIQRKVALKIIKLGMNTRHVVARFEVERQALAMMDHPGVAKVFDAGSTETGRPYFVMELVKGSPITEFCDKQRLDIRQRLELFVQVCQAVQHAHQKGIIHRDIKPSNVLVAMHDNRALAKVIDFGIAKATQSRLTEKTLFTEFRQLIGTPAYMSPEQADGALDIDMRSDVYELGVLLYELLTGTTPFDNPDLMRKAYAEIQRIIREVYPPKPSTRLSQNTETLPSIAAQRQVAPNKLESTLRGELDWIVMRALEKDRARRYETANALATDVQRFLSGEPVVAAPPSRAYRLRKLVRRNKGTVIALSTIAALLIAGTIGTTMGLIGQARQRAQVEQQAAMLRAVLDFQSRMLASADPEEGVGDKATVLQVITAAMAELDAGALKGQPLVEAKVRETIGSTLQRLGRSDLAEPILRRALELRQSALPAEHIDIARSLNNLAWALTEGGFFMQAEPMHRQALAIFRKELPANDPELATSMGNLGLTLTEAGKPAEAELLFREALALRRQASPPDAQAIAVALNNLAFALQPQAKYAEAELVYREALGLLRTALPPEHPRTMQVESNLATLLMAQGQFAQAEQLLAESMEARRQKLPEGHPNIAKALNNLGGAMEMQGKFVAAELRYREAYEMAKKSLPPGHPMTATYLGNIALVLYKQHKLDESEQLNRDALAMKQAALPPTHRDVATALNNLALVLLDKHRETEAEPLFRDAVQIYRSSLPPGHQDLGQVLVNYGRVEIALGKRADADRLLREAREVLQRKLRSNDPQLLLVTGLVASNLRELGQVNESALLFRELLATLDRVDSTRSMQWQQAYARTGLGLCLKLQQKFTEAESLLIQAEQLTPTDLPRDRRQRRQLLADFYDQWNKADPGKGYDAESAKWRTKIDETPATTPSTTRDG